MRTVAVMLGASLLAVYSGTAVAKERHHVRHVQRAAVPAQSYASTLPTAGNNPAKSYATRTLSANAVREGTLYRGGNNPAKFYPTRKPSENAVREGTLATTGNNPAKRYNAAR